MRPMSMSWFDILLNSTISTTQYLKDNYQNVDFKVISQEENGNKIVRVSEFIKDNKVVVHSSVEIDVEENPEVFIRLIRDKVIPIGDILKSNNYRVERKILNNDSSSKEYVMMGDVDIKITEKYYDM
ncbi:hypothetical protein CUJ83_15250 [Methanocella sp. CWC-04]|uniref:Uncharacterized protein n=1 Tax=Methanooceanicella nereidis TaxID=2052831 RepID=A0AAP2RHJ7_9EURY|nr:hypothetical protein [Methanocella sp. CWC-04]MCD1296357.1 hypothetical protein [Methanocella sp. CWC-04]